MGLLITDFVKGTALGLKLSRHHIINSYVKVPIGIFIMMLILYGVNEIIILTTISFPASVTCMLLLYLILIILTKFFGERKVATLVKLVEIPGGFCLRWINIFFTPAFVTLPLCEWISAKEALTIAAVFVIGYLLATAAIAYFTILLQHVLKKGRKSNIQRGEELDLLQSNNESLDGNTTALKGHQISNGHVRKDSEGSMSSITMDNHLDRIRSLNDVPRSIINDIAKGDANEEEENYIKRMNSEQDSIVNFEINHPENIIDAALMTPTSSTESAEYYSSYDRGVQSLELPSMPSPIKSSNRYNNPGVDIKFEKNKLFCKRAVLEQHPVIKPDDSMIKIAHVIKNKFDYFIFGILFVVGLPIYFTEVNYEMPLQLAVAIFTFLFMLRVPPPKWKRFLHPVLCSVALSLLIFYLFSLMKHEGFLLSIKQYKTGKNYLKLFKREYDGMKPGAGDIFSSLMDVSIVSLAIPMYTYRKDLKKHFVEILLPILVMSAGCFFIYPLLCYHVGISSERSLGFAGRSVTLALGTPFVKALGGSESLMAVTTVVSGILGALTCEPLFKLMRIREDDYVTRGITLGLNCAAIATAHLLTVDPRAAAMSSLSFVLFGTMMVVMASITPLADVVKALAGL